MNEPALLELFNRLREAGLPLGLEEYHLLLQAVDRGFGKDDRNALAQLCSTLWVKSEQEQLIFQEYFDQLIPEDTRQHVLPSTTKASRYQERIVDNSRLGNANTKNGKPVRGIRYIILGVIAALVTAIVIPFIPLLRPKPLPENPGTLSFKTDTFSNSLAIIQENDKNPKILIARTGGSRGEVSATIIIDETDDYYLGKSVKFWELLIDEGDDDWIKIRASLKDFQETSITVTFTDGKSGVQEVPIPILDDKSYEGNEPITFQLTNPQGQVKIIPQDIANFTINDTEDKDNSNFDNPKDPMTDYPKKDNTEKPLHPLIAIIYLVIFFGIIMTGWLTILMIVVKKISLRKKIRASDQEDTEDLTNLPIAKLSPQVIQTLFDEIQVAKAIQQPNTQLGETFLIINNHLPITYRQMKQGWRYLRHLMGEGVPTELDLEATIDQIGQQGILLNPVLKPCRINKIELLLLIDQDGSMVPFNHFSQALVDTASRGGRFNQVRVYYFHNCPSDYLYQDPYHLEAVPIEDCLSQLPKTRVVCLIFSDAGAARGQFSSRRRRRTKFFLKELKHYVPPIAWLNPFPSDRWESTTAEEIAKLVPMFEVNRQGLYQAIETLRGRDQKLGKS
ncbi:MULTISPECIES: hypothetical protein [unclassified Moorena]|uniref:Calx-beta domain-containing protein n=1 Tax=unclassified Moorena TaxID=2683338 RepID=UPI0014012AC9|nr:MULTISPECIES: hypothetical protein [unclassified Moorena]NEO13521.1 hypothetical protein [Moorena sp. SIO3E8]NEP98516.1 hypothetical protein [Moorena sp. SIO3F7]